MATSSASSNNTPRTSLFRAKAGFVIPKNKLSGSLVPAFRGAKKAEGSEATPEESIKKLQRKTRWGPDLAQDASVRKGRALAYQTRVDQITQLLKSGTISNEGNEQSTTSSKVSDLKLSSEDKDEKLEDLELERQEIIGEILRLNPSYKPPSDYQPLMREALLPIPVKGQPGCNFVSLVLGPGSDTQKRLEKETGSRIRVFGTDLETGRKVEVTSFNDNELLSSYDHLDVQIFADSYEKVDAAVSLLELLLASVSGKAATSSVEASVSGDNSLLASTSEGANTNPGTEAAMQGPLQPVSGSMVISQSNFPPSPGTGPWVHMGLPQTPSSSSFSLSSTMPLPTPPYGAPSMASFRHVFSPQDTYRLAPPNPNFGPPQPAIQFSQHTLAPPYHQIRQSNSQNTIVSCVPPFSGHQPSLAMPTRFPGSLYPTGSSGRPGPPNPIPGPSLTGSPLPSPQMGSSSIPSTCFPPRPLNGPPMLPTPRNQPAPSPSMLVHQYGQAYPSNAPRGAPMGHPAQIGFPSPRPPTVPSPSFTPLRPASGVRGSNQINSGDFTFQPNHSHISPSQSPHGPRNHQAPQLLQTPQPPSFRPVMPNPGSPQPRVPNPMRPAMSSHLGHFTPSNMNSFMEMRNHGPYPQSPGAGPFPPRPANLSQFPQNQPARPGSILPLNHGFGGNLPLGGSNKPANVQQSYDPFLPSSASAASHNQGSNVENVKKQENDPEYEDLMASVGVK